MQKEEQSRNPEIENLYKLGQVTSWTPLGHVDRTTNRRKEVKGKVPLLDQFDLFPLLQKYIWQL